MKAYITYDYLYTQDIDRDDNELDYSIWEYGNEVEILTILPPSYISNKDQFRNGLFLVRKGNNVEGFDGQYISFVNPNRGELN